MRSSSAVLIQGAARRMLAKKEFAAIKRGDHLEAMRFEHMRLATAGEVRGDYDREDLGSICTVQAQQRRRMAQRELAGCRRNHMK